MKTSRPFAKISLPMMLAALLLALLLSMTGCRKSFVIIPGGQTISLPKQTVDELYMDRELLIQALEECQAGRQW